MRRAAAFEEAVAANPVLYLSGPSAYPRCMDATNPGEIGRAHV